MVVVVTGENERGEVREAKREGAATWRWWW